MSFPNLITHRHMAAAVRVHDRHKLHHCMPPLTPKLGPSTADTVQNLERDGPVYIGISCCHPGGVATRSLLVLTTTLRKDG